MYKVELSRMQARLGNENSVTRAKPEIVEKEREKLAAQEERVSSLLSRCAELTGQDNNAG